MISSIFKDVDYMKVVARPIEVIAWFTKEGVPMPVRFRVQDEDENQVIKINKIITKDREKLAGNEMMSFTCESIINGAQKIYELKYELRTCKWILFKI